MAALEPAAGTAHIWARNMGGPEQWGYLQAVGLAAGTQAASRAARIRGGERRMNDVLLSCATMEQEKREVLRARDNE